MSINPYKERDRNFFKALVYTRSGDLDLGWGLLLLFSLISALVVIWTVIWHPAAIPIQLAALSFLGAAFTSVLIAAIPIAKARILAGSRVPGEVAKSIASIQDVEESTDIQELSQAKNKKSDVG